MLGERSILLQWPWQYSEENLNWLLKVKHYIELNILKHKVEVINTYNSLLIIYRNTINVIYDDFEDLKSIDFRAIETASMSSRLFELPVCYDEEFGIDLKVLAHQKKLTISEIIHLHTAPIYTLYFMGFLPGFLYLGGMDKKLAISRKSEPRMQIKKGAVGIAENQTGIYPKSSPGGWQIIGNCPLNFFDPLIENPSPFSAGDRIRFYEVKKQEYDEISELVKSGKYTLKSVKK